MSYSLHIEKQGSEIELQEWISAIEPISNARLQSENLSADNPKTGEEVLLYKGQGDVEVKFNQKRFFGFGEKSSWEPCFRFSNGRASFNASEDIESSTNPVHQVAVAVAKALSAQIVGDEGEVYEW